MAFRKLTKKQYKNRQRILAWLNDEEFKENARAERVVPDLSVGEVLEFYVPPDVTGSAQFFTPAEMSEALIMSYMNIPLYDDDVRILDPCAGIGHLLWPLLRADNHLDLVAYEIEEECVKIGRRLFPRIDWYWEIPFDHLDQLEARFDYVIMNPPFGVTRGMASGWEMSEGRCTKSEHVFLELAVRACKPEGQIGVIAPWNFWSKLPKKLRAWLDDKVTLECEMGRLPGEFEMTKVRMHGYILGRTDEVLAWVQEVNKKGEELDDLCSWTHPTAWHEDPDIVKAKEEWKELAGAGAQVKTLRYVCAVCGVGIEHRDIIVTSGVGTYIGRCCSDEWSFDGDHKPVCVRRGPDGYIVGTVVQNGLLDDVQPRAARPRRVTATQLSLFNSVPPSLVGTFGETPARTRPQASLPEGAPLRLCTQDTDGKPREGGAT